MNGIYIQISNISIEHSMLVGIKLLLWFGRYYGIRVNQHGFHDQIAE